MAVIPLLVFGGGSPAQASTLQCNDGTYNQRLVTTGSCAWGHVDPGVAINVYWVKINMVVVDTANDGRCAHFDYRHRLRGTSVGAVTTIVATACGYGRTAVAQTTIGGMSVVEAVDIRVCTTGLSCTAWKQVL